MSQAEAEVWLTTVNALPSEWFTSEHGPVLTAYVRAAVRLAAIDTALAKCKLRDAANYDRLAKLARQEGAALLRLARALRLTPSTRLKSSTAGRRAGYGAAPGAGVDFNRLEEETE